MKFAGKVYAGDLFLGKISSNTLRGLKQKASRLCNGYYKVCDEVRLYYINGKEDYAVMTRINKISPNNECIRGAWY